MTCPLTQIAQQFSSFLLGRVKLYDVFPDPDLYDVSSDPDLYDVSSDPDRSAVQLFSSGQSETV